MPSTYFVHAQLTRDLFAIAKFLVRFISQGNVRAYFVYVEQDYTCDSEVKSWNRTATFTSPRRRLCYCHSIILSVWRISVKVIRRFHWNLMSWLDVYLTGRKNWLTVGSRIRIPDHFSTAVTIAKQGILGDLLAFLIQSPPEDTRQNDWHWQRNESTFWERSGRHPDPNSDWSGNLDSNPGLFVVEVRPVGGGLRSPRRSSCQSFREKE